MLYSLRTQAYFLRSFLFPETTAGNTSAFPQSICLIETKKTNNLSVGGAYEVKWPVVDQGVPQGSVLGTLLFSLFMNDLPCVVKTSSVQSYVDDAKVYLSSSSSSSNDIDFCLSKITEVFHLIAASCCSNQLLINPSKTKFILFATRQLLSKVSDVKVPFFAQ